MLADPHSILQFINQIIVEDILANNSYRWTSSAIQRLKSLGVTQTPRGRELTQNYLLAQKYKLTRGLEPLFLPTLLHNKLGLRIEKDRVYSITWSHVDMYLNPPLKYCGLAATNIGVISKKVDSLTCCEKNRAAADLLKKIRNILLSDAVEQILIKQVDILKHLSTTDNKYNILDLDLMCHLNVEKTATAIKKSAENKTVVALTTSIGRNTTWEIYKKKRQQLKNMLEEEFEVLMAGGKYLERKIPMAYEHIVLVR